MLGLSGIGSMKVHQRWLITNRKLTMQISNELQNAIKPCPFCGKRPQWFGSGENNRGLMIECETPGCVNPHVSYYDHNTAVEVWNQRKISNA